MIFGMVYHDLALFSVLGHFLARRISTLVHGSYTGHEINSEQVTSTMPRVSPLVHFKRQFD